MFRDHAVLQRGVPVPIWGTAEPGRVVEIRIFPTRQPPETMDRQVDMLTNVVVGADGRWRAVLPAFPTTPANTIPNVLMVDYVAPADEAGATIGAASAPEGAGARAEDILFGDVWLCSGQSNMDMNYGWGLTRGKEDVETNAHARIRLFDDRNRTALSPQRDLPDDYGWTPCDPAHSKSFSAVGYFFGQALQEAMPDVPIGLIEASWSGSPIKTWIPYESAEAIGGDFGRQAGERRAIAEAWVNGGAEQFKVDLAAWMEKLDKLDKSGDGLEVYGDAFSKPWFDDSAWGTATLPEITEKHTSPGFDGIVCYRKTFVVEVPDPGDSDADIGGVLHLGPIDDQDWTYVNGKLVGSTNAWDAPRNYNVSLVPGTNVVAVKVLDWGGHSGMWTKDPAALRIDGIVFCPSGVRSPDDESPTGYDLPAIPLAGKWKFKAIAAEPRPVDPSSPSSWDIAACHNGMVAPLFGMAAKGAIWYQGCSDVGSEALYEREFPAMVEAWRKGFKHDDAGFPVYLVQLAAFKETHAEPLDSVWARMRWTQMKLGETVPHCGTAVALDVGDHRDIHPKDKKTVGERLARLALARTYGQADQPLSPLPESACYYWETGEVWVKFSDPGSGTPAKLRRGDVKGFELKNPETGAFVRAKAFVPLSDQISADVVIIEWNGGPTSPPPLVRYAWDDYPDCNLVNGDGLPCGPFELEIKP